LPKVGKLLLGAVALFATLNNRISFCMRMALYCRERFSND